MGPTMIAIARQTYEGKSIGVGQQFQAISELDADDLVAVRMAQRVKVPAKPFQRSEPAKVTTRDVSTDHAEAAADAPENADTSSALTASGGAAAAITQNQHGKKGQYENRAVKSR